MPFAPKYQFSISPDYSFPITADTALFVGSSVNYRTGTISVVGGEINPPQATPQDICVYCIKGYTLVDVRAGISLQDNKMRISLYGKNVLNEYYWTDVHNSSDSAVRYAGMPATYGIAMQYKW